MSKKPPSPTPAAVSRARETAGLNQTEAAAKIGRTMRAWQTWEGGQRKMPGALWALWQQRALGKADRPVQPVIKAAEAVVVAHAGLSAEVTALSAALERFREAS